MNENRTQPERTLVIDDDSFTLKLMERILTLQGFTDITTNISGADALAFLDQSSVPVTLIFLDLNMPEMDGIEFIRHLVKRRFSGSIILMSGEDERMLKTAERLIEAHQIEVPGYLQKPVTAESLSAVLNKWQINSNSLLKSKVYQAKDLQTAIDQGQLKNYYQPKVALGSGQVIGVEVLVRWEHPVDGMVFPDQFISLAEENGLINELTSWVVKQGLAQYQRWLQQGLNLPLAINVSMESLASLDFADNLSVAVLAAQALPKNITLEITESRAMKNPATTLDTLTRLRLKRFILAIDDFGTGHSSLAQLRDIPFDEFKIDKSFVYRAWEDKRIKIMFDASLSLAKQLDMKAVAEGVETVNDWQFLRKTSCDYAQGYFISPPMLAEAIPAWIMEWNERVQNELIPKSSQAASASAQKGTILIVEDHDFQRRIQSKILRDEGYNVIMAASGIEALNLLRTLRPTLILLDIELPGMSGLEVSRRLRSTSIFKETPIVIISGSSNKDIVMESLKAGVTTFMAKPFDRETLIEKIKSALAANKK